VAEVEKPDRLRIKVPEDENKSLTVWEKQKSDKMWLEFRVKDRQIGVEVRQAARKRQTDRSRSQTGCQ
jgi:hypothetical protein